MRSIPSFLVSWSVGLSVGTDHGSIYESKVYCCSFVVPWVVGGESRGGDESRSESGSVCELSEECDVNVSGMGWEWVSLHRARTREWVRLGWRRPTG